jgi:hypothetical protein
MRLGKHKPDEQNMMTSYLSEELGAVSKELQTKSSHTNCVGIDDRGSAVESPVEESKSSNESEKKRFSSTGHNKPPELVPYCSDMHVSHPNDDSSSPPHLFPEAIMTGSKLSKSLPGKTFKDAHVISIGSSASQNRDFMECIEFNDSSEFECDEEYVIAPKLKRKIGPLCNSLDLSLLKRGRWRNAVETDIRLKGNEKSIFRIFLNMRLGRTRLKERDKLRKASERMRRSPRALTPKEENTEKISILEGECGAGVNTAGTGTHETGTGGSNITTECPEPSSHLDREYTRTFSQKKSYMVYKAINYSPLTESTEGPRKNVAECIDISGESVDSFESRVVEGEPGRYFFNEVALSEPTLKHQCTKRNKGCKNCRESGFSLYCNQLACDVDKDVKEEVAGEICSLSKIAENHSNSSIHNKFNKEQDNANVCIKSGNDLQNSKGLLKGVQSKLKPTQKRVFASEQTSHVGLFQKQVTSLQNYVLSEGDEKEYGTGGNAGESPVNNSIKVADSSSYYCKRNMTHEAKIYSIDEIASHLLNEKLKNENAEFTTSAMCESNRIKQCCVKQEGNLSECDLSENDTLEVKKKHHNMTLQTAESSLLEGYKKADSQKGSLGSMEIKTIKCEGAKEGIPKSLEHDFVTCSDTITRNKRESSCRMVAGSSSDSICTDSLRESDFNDTSKLNSSHSSEKGVNYQSDVSCGRMMVDSFGRNLLAGCDIVHDDIDPNVYVNQDPNNWPIVEDDEDYEDYVFTLPKRVSTGKEERDVIDGIEMLSFETEHDMVEFTKIQQDFCHGSSVDDGMIQSDDGLDMMDDTFPLCGDVDLQYIHQAIVPTKTNDITKIKGWRNKQFAVNDNPSHYCGSFSSEAYEDDDGFESCDVKTTDETNVEEDQQNHWYSENTKHNGTNLCTTIKDKESQATEDKMSSGSCGKQKSNPMKDDVMLSYGTVCQPKAAELLKHLQKSVNETKSSKSAFVSDILDNYLSTYSQLNVSYEIPKLGAEEGITHCPEYERDKFILPSPPRHQLTVSEKLCVPRRTGPKPKTLAEKRKMLEKEMLKAESIKGQKRCQRGRPRLHSLSEPVAPTKFPTNSDAKKPVTVKCLSSTPQKKDLEQNTFILDPDYKYAWVGKRPIRITGSKVNKEPALNEHSLSLSVQSEVKQDPVLDSIVSDVTQKENEAVTDKKSSDEIREQNISMNDLTTAENLPPSPPNNSTDPTKYGIVVYPGIGHPLHPLAMKQLMQMRSTDIFIDKEWAEFSVAVVTSSKDINIHDQKERHVIPIKCIPLFEDLKISPHKKDEVPRSHSETAPLNIEIPKDSDSGFSPFKIIPISPEPELSKHNPSFTNSNSLVTVVRAGLKATCVDAGNSKADENLSSAPNCVSRDEVQSEVKCILEEMVDCILIHEIEDTIIQDDPDASIPVTMITPKCPKKDIGKYMKNKVYRELNRLDVNVIVMEEDRNGCIEKIYGSTSCEKDFCQLGCVCASLRTSQPSASDHCGKIECMFECSCQELSSDQSNNNSNAEKPSLLYCTAMRLQDEENRHLAKVEKEFRHTVIQSKNEVIVLRGSSSGDGGRRRREIKLPERYRDSSVVLGKEFAMTEFKMITGEDVSVTPAPTSYYNTRRSERQSSLPNCVEAGVPKSASVSITKPLHKPTKRKITPGEKVSLWREDFKVKPCSVRIERTEGLENVAPWCMVHLRYDCFCSKQSLEPCKRMPSQSIERPPPVPGPPLDSTETKMDVVKHQSRISRNMAVKSTSQIYPHAHDVYRHSARTVGSAINYALRNQSHFFKRRHEMLCLQKPETECKLNNALYSPFQITEPVNIIPKFDMTPGKFVMQAGHVSLNEQEVIPVNTDIGGDNEEVGFGKIVSIMSLKPEEFEKCGSEDQAQHEADGACNMDMFLHTEGQLTGVLTAERNVSEENGNVIKISTEMHGSEKEQVCNSDEKSCESEIYEKLPSVLIPVLPGSSRSVNSARLAELISKKDCELRTILKNCMMPLNLSQSAAGSIQLIGWNTLMNQIENRTYHLWLQYKCGSMAKLIITGTTDKPDEYCVSLSDSYFDSPPDFHNKLPPFITFLIEQLNVKDRIRGVSSEDKNCFWLLQFDGDNWELVGSLLRNVCSVDWCSNRLAQSHVTEQANHQETSDRQQQDQNFVKSQKERSNDIAEEHSYFIEQESRKRGEFRKESGSRKINMNTVASLYPPLINLRKHQSGVNSSQESMVENSQTIEESLKEQHGQTQKNRAHPDLPLKEQDLLIDEPVLCESTGILLDMKKRLRTQLMQANSVETTGTTADLTDIDRVCNEGASAVCNNESTSDSLHKNGKTVKKGTNQESDTTDAYTTERKLVMVPVPRGSRWDLPFRSNSKYGSSDLKVKDSRTQTQSNDVKGKDCEEVSMLIVKERPCASKKTKVTTDQTKVTTDQQSALEQSVTSPVGALSVRLSNNYCNTERIYSSGIEVPLPTGPNPARWYMLNIKNRFDLLHLSHSKCIIRYAQLIRAVYLANSHGKTVRVPLEKRLSNAGHGKNMSLLHEQYRATSAAQPKFGVYTVPNLYTRVFIGPYGLREDAGVGAIKLINGRLVNTMYLNPQQDSVADNDDITALLESSGEGAALNTKLEKMYDSIARAPEDRRVCRGMWLYTTRSEDKASALRNVKASPISIDENRVSSASTRSSTSSPVTEIVGAEQNTETDTKKSCTYLQGENEIKDGKSCSESGHAAQHLTDDTETDSRREGSRLKQILNLQNIARMTTTRENVSVRETPTNVGKEHNVEEGEMKQRSSKANPLLAIAESDSSTRDVISPVKPDSDGDVVDVDAPSHSGTLLQKTSLLPGTKRVASETSAKSENSSLQKHQKQIAPEPTDNATSSSASVNR